MIERRHTGAIAADSLLPGFFEPGSLFEKEQNLFFHTYKRLSLDIVRGEGVYLFDRRNKRYLDLVGGLAVNALGYGNDRVIEAIERQIRKYIHLSNYFVQEPQVRLAEKIISASGYEKIFFTNSGTEAIEGAIKLARKWGKGTKKQNLFGMSNAFHGRTMGALSLMDKTKYKDDYGPFLPHCSTLQFNDVEDLRRSIDDQTLGVVIEFIQGEGGIYVPGVEYIRVLKELQTRHGFLLIADEIQCGLGRTGKVFGFEHFNVSPDIVVLAKAIGGGLPLGAFLGNKRLAETFTYGVHGTTFGGNPVACAAGLAALEQIFDGGLMANAAKIGAHLRSSLEEVRREFPSLVREVRGFGCMIGIELTREVQPVVDELQSRGILVNGTNVNVIRLLPPLIVGIDHCDEFVAQFREILSTLK